MNTNPPGNLPHPEKISYTSFVAIQNSPFVTVQPHGTKSPFYACGHHPRLISLARALGTDQPLYKMDAHALLQERLAEGCNIDLRIEEIANYFVAEILASRRGGPISLGGGCEGAIIAFEVAQQLERLGCEIAMLVIWDTPVSKYWPDESPRLISIRRLRRLFSGGRVEFKRRLRIALSVAKGDSTDAGDESSKRRMYIEQVLMKAAKNYVAKSYSGHIILFRASESNFECSEPTLGYGELAKGGVEIFVLPGNHHTYFEQNFASFAERLKICLTKTQNR